MQITEDIGRVVNEIIACPEVAQVFDSSLALALAPIQKVDYVVGLTEEIEGSQISPTLMSKYQELKELAPSYFEADNKPEPVKIHPDWGNCHKPTYRGN